MVDQVSPGVDIREVDKTGSIQGASTSIGAIVGDFAWGPVNVIRLVSNESELVDRYGQPKSTSATDFLVASQFLSYSSALKVVRAADVDSALNATDGTPMLIKSEEHFDEGLTTDGGVFHAKYPGVLGNSLQVVVLNNSTFDVDSTVTEVASASDLFDGAPNSGEVHVVVYDEDGDITGTAGTVLETFSYLGIASGSKSVDGSNNYVVDVINNQSAWVWLDASTTFSSLATDDSDTTNDGVYSLSGGVDGTTEEADYQLGWDVFAEADGEDVSLLITSDASQATAQYVANSVADVRKDCVAFISPEKTDVVGSTTPLDDVTSYRTSLGLNTSYAVMDSGWKQVYNKYQERYEWVPLNGDIAGLCALTDQVADTWFSPAGLARGSIRNAVRLAWNPNKANRDELYKNGVNPVVNLSGRGTVLWGDKTLLTRPSAFDRINVRRLFIALRKTIGRASERQLFEFNDEFSRANFVALVEPFLREVQGRRGVTDFRVVCDETNNTASVINANRFVGDIYVRPNRSVNFVRLNFIAVAEGVEFSEVAGQ